MTGPTIMRLELVAQPILFIRREIEWAEIGDTLGQCFGAIAAYCEGSGMAPAGPPFVRYPGVGPERLTIEAGMPVASPIDGNGEIEAGFLQAGPAAATVHVGHYDKLRETYSAVEQWIKANGLTMGGAPWESYVTDPGETEPAAWRTEIYWPVAE